MPIAELFYRFTISNPFIEDENQRDIKVRIAERTINWGILDDVGVSPLGTLASPDPSFTNPLIAMCG
jgi:hypothetical protein